MTTHGVITVWLEWMVTSLCGFSVFCQWINPSLKNADPFSLLPTNTEGREIDWGVEVWRTLPIISCVFHFSFSMSHFFPSRIILPKGFGTHNQLYFNITLTVVQANAVIHFRVLISVHPATYGDTTLALIQESTSHFIIFYREIRAALYWNTKHVNTVNESKTEFE